MIDASEVLFMVFTVNICFAVNIGSLITHISIWEYFSRWMNTKPTKTWYQQLVGTNKSILLNLCSSNRSKDSTDATGNNMFCLLDATQDEGKVLIARSTDYAKHHIYQSLLSTNGCWCCCYCFCSALSKWTIQYYSLIFVIPVNGVSKYSMYGGKFPIDIVLKIHQQ